MRYPAPFAPPGVEIPRLDFGNGSRATPQIGGKLVYFLGAFGNLTAAELETGSIAWQTDLYGEFEVRERSKWGLCCSPLLIDDMVIVGPGGDAGGIVALDATTGKVRWKSKTNGAGHSSFHAATLGGKKQIIGYDAISLGGWDLQSGRRLWTLVPPKKSDFNVGTPVVVGENLFVATENNGSRLYRFHKDGTIDPTPIGKHAELAPDSHTPVAVGSRIFGVWNNLYCLDAGNQLKELWQLEDSAFLVYTAVICSPTRVAALTQHAEFFLLDANANKPTVLSRCVLFENEKGVYSHPAFVGNRLYMRNSSAIVCFDLSEPAK